MNASDIDNEINRSRSLSEIRRAKRLRVLVEVLRFRIVVLETALYGESKIHETQGLFEQVFAEYSWDRKSS